MKMNKFLNGKKLIFITLVAIILSCMISAYAVFDKRADAYSAVDESTSVTDAIYNFDDYCYNQSALDQMSSQILSSMGAGQNKKLDDLITYAKSTASAKGKAVGGNAVITLKYGRYRFTGNGTYRNLVWMPVYLSRSNSGDAILTLYLSATENANGSTSQQEALQFSHDGLYSTAQSCAAPSNSYGSSHMRTVSLGNVKTNGAQSQYASYDLEDPSSSYSRLYNATLKDTNYNKFSDFVKGDNFTGTLYDDIATPSELSWQADESYADYINDPAYQDYAWPNEAYGTPAHGSYYMPSYFDYNETNKTNYNIWQYDKVWLPSLTEVGTGDIDGVGTDTTNGIWKLTAAKRSNKITSWLRTANTTVAKTNGYSTYTMFAIDKTGSITNADVNEVCAIRPAIHLNLSKIIDKTTAPVNLPDVVKSVYTGDFQTIESIPEDQRKWYTKEDLIVSFSIDPDGLNGTTPINAGNYYIRVELRSSSTRPFKNPDPNHPGYKIVPFVVEKVKLDVQWTYASDDRFAEPTAVNFVGNPEDIFYERDITANNVPTLGMKYSNITNAGIQNSPEYPDKIGWYTAKAYIIDEEIRNFNYEISSDNVKSHQFEVLQKRIAVPYFLESGTSSLSLNYKGRQYVQIANASKYVEIVPEVVGVTGSDSKEEAFNKIEDMGTVNGVQTYIIESVASYRFNVKLVDPVNTVWGETGTDISDKRLTLNINKAEITLTFEGLPSSWERARRVEFEVNILGVYNQADKIDLFVGYVLGNNQRILMTPQNGKYIFTSNMLAVGEYYISAGLQNSNGNYYIDSIKYGAGAVTQKFKVTATEPDFDSSKVKWHYRLAGDTAWSNAINFDEYDNPNHPLELDNKQNYYEFALTLTASMLSGSPYYVKATYSGDTYVKDAGLHSVTVTISAYDRNIDFAEQTYTIYFRIKMAKFDLSGLKWNYTGPFTYTGNEHKVFLNFPAVPSGATDPLAGLTVIYKTDGAEGNSALNAGSHKTKVTFVLSDEAKVNYAVPDANVPDSYIYNGTDPLFTLDWEINKRDIEADWVTESPSGEVFFVPYLKTGNNFVNYTFERKDGANWVPVTGITSTEADQTYRVTAALKSAYTSNLNLTGTLSKEFAVSAGKFAVTTHIEANGKESESGAAFTYNGNPINLQPVVDTGDATISSYTVKYYPVGENGGRGVELPSAPANAGKYVAVITTNFVVNSVTYQSESEFEFEIVKADVDLSNIRWTYSHGNKTMSARYDVDQKKWVNDDGSEAKFAFPYDGTKHEITLTGYENVAGLTFNSVSGVSGTAVREYTANISWYVDETNYNELPLPKTFKWEIIKAPIDFSGVKWGYIDEEGNECEFTSDEYKFIFTRDENKNAVRFTVALINLPSHIKDLFTYKTRSYTDNNFGSGTGGVVASNSFALVGEYHTEVVINSSFVGDSNYEEFNMDSFPTNISPFIDWEIAPRELVTPSYDGSWVIFDDKVHNLIELCGVPEEQLNYYSIEITFIDKSNNIQNYYEGYAPDGQTPVPYTAHGAGTYLVRFYELVGDTNVAGYIVAQVEITVEQEKLEVVWDSNGSIPVARVRGIYASDMIGTRYYVLIGGKDGTVGAEVDIAYITSTNGDVWFLAEPFVTEKYANNLGFEMAENEVATNKFNYEEFIKDGNTVMLELPVMEKETIEYTGSAITFKIAQWDSKYSNYLYISDGELTQTEIGVYHVKVSFIKTANACWIGTDVDRSSYDLTFEITKPTKQPLDYPIFDRYSAEYKENTPQVFHITNWVVLQEYVEFEVFFNGKSLGTSATITTLSYIEAGIYSVVFRIKEGSIGVWIADPDNPKKDYTVQFRIIDPNANDKQLLTPTLQASSKEYTGNALEFRVDNWDDNLEVSLPAGVTFAGGVFTATEIGSYEIIVRIKTAGYTFADGEITCTLTIVITPPTGPGVTVRLPKPVFGSSSVQIVDGKAEFKISNWESMRYSDYLTLSCDNENVRISGGTVTATKAGTYKLVINFKQGVNAEWQGGGTGAVELSFTATETAAPAEAKKLPRPVLANSELEFTGKDITFEIRQWEEVYKKYVAFKSGSLVQKDVGTYQITISLRDPSVAVWEDGSVEDITLEFSIKRAKLTANTGEDGAPVIKNGDDVIVDIGDYFDKEYYDPDTGERVPEDQLEDGKEYDVKYKFKEDKREEFESKVENSEQFIKDLESHTYNEIYHKPSGLSLMWILIIAGAVILVIIIIIIIVVAVKRRGGDNYYYNNYEDGGYNEYDEYEEYEDYEDDEDGDYDEYEEYEEYEDDEY